MDINYYKQYEPIFGSWRITRQIGEGSFGKVFEIEREDFGVTYRAALKAITVPASESELLEVKADGMDDASVRTYFGSFVEELVREFALMSRLKGNSNVVSYEDHQVIEHPDDIGWDILIRMELLTPLNWYTSTHTVTRQDVIKLGIDLCRALELCQKYNIIHRDIKPENIFVSDTGDFKLGDFGIARTVEKTTSGLSKKGTYTYMAPEVYKGEAYGSTVDIYSLGIVLYRLLNGNRTPFLPAAPAPITHADRENALARRFSGAPLPAPSHAQGRLAEIVLKACAYDPKERYSSPMQMRQELESILYNREESKYIYPEGDDVPQDSVHYVKTGEEPSVAETEATQRDSEAGRKEQKNPEEQKEQDGRIEYYDSTVSDFGGTVSDFACSTGENGDFGRTASQAVSSLGNKNKRKVFLGAVAASMVLIMGIVIGTGGGKKDGGGAVFTGSVAGVSDSGASGNEAADSGTTAEEETFVTTRTDLVDLSSQFPLTLSAEDDQRMAQWEQAIEAMKGSLSGIDYQAMTVEENAQILQKQGFMRQENTVETMLYAYLIVDENDVEEPVYDWGLSTCEYGTIGGTISFTKEDYVILEAEIGCFDEDCLVCMERTELIPEEFRLGNAEQDFYDRFGVTEEMISWASGRHLKWNNGGEDYRIRLSIRNELSEFDCDLGQDSLTLNFCNGRLYRFRLSDWV